MVLILLRIVVMKPSVTCASLLLVGSLLAACGGGAQSGGPKVVASFYPFAFVAEQVGGRAVDVDNLTAPGTEPHDIELRPQQVGGVQDADLLIYQRGFQTAVDDAVDRAHRADTDVVDVADLVPSTHDPHTWLDPRTMIAITKAVEEKLSAADPDHASTYAANATQLIEQLDDLDHELAAGLKTCRTRTIVTSHAAFGHLSERYDLKQVPIAGIDPTNEPTPSWLGRISDLVRREHITTVFTEELVSPAIAETVARETGARTATLDPIEGLGGDARDETYLTLMHHNLDAIREANGCS
jgi:zinc transport system substrate-binding protein